MADTKPKKKTTSNTNTKKPAAKSGGKTASQQPQKGHTESPSSKPSGGASPKKAPSEGSVQLLTLLLIVVGLFLFACMLFPDLTGSVGNFLHDFTRGLLGRAAFLIPLLFLIGAGFLKKDIEYHAVSFKVLFGTLLTVFTSVLFHAPVRNDPLFKATGTWELLCAFYDGGIADLGGGVLGGVTASLLGYLGLAGILIVSIPAVCLLALYYVGMTPKSLYITILYKFYKYREQQAEYRAAAAPDLEARQAELDARQAELDRMRKEQAQRAAEVRRVGRERKAAEQILHTAGRRSGAIDENIYAVAPTTDAPDTRAAESAASTPKAAIRRPPRTGDPVPGEVFARESVPTEEHTVITVDTATGEVLSEMSPAPDENAYSLAAKDEAAALDAGLPSEDTAAHTETLHAEHPASPVYTPTGELDLSAIFTNPEDATQIQKHNASAADTVEQAEMELTVRRLTPDGCESAEEDDTPPWETQPTQTCGTVFRYADSAPKPKPMDGTPEISPNGMTQIPDVVSRERIDTAIRTGTIGTDGTAMHAQPGSIPHDASEDETATALLASLNNMYSAQNTQTSAEPPPYVYPPVTLLKKDTSDRSEDTVGELEENARKLTEILRSFNVKTKIVNVSRGPTITRYELQPEAGTRVRSIANLVDDIALGLAADGVRIEAPIPGKGAIGIEVPNASVSTVYIRDLIDSDAFTASRSKVTTALGKDVAGAPIFLDAAKMPHLLICGATGMGKSVCINSLIVSILYKATPEEVKLILIDPKKVELNIYSGIPHLLVPVVSDPKKAAGALHWAVTEMERRFALIEDVGMRDINGYNSITKNDPDREYLPQIVIIIDELADLMMTAPDEVEESICRLAQKARAAGMYLIIGTQRPSVDVITGLIKANIPSRIAFRVSSQMDSRVILDEVGAEKLIGRGDMLYKPVGAPKPKRVQGSFVSEDEIDNITTFLKKTAGHAEYADDVMESIEREAALCGQKKSSHAADDGDDFDGDGTPDDPMLKSAVELAVESGKISTSLIQRRLSLGYGRAAKLIDRMEQLGYVSPPEGQKPRSVLITKEQYMELVLKQGGIIGEDF